MGGEAAREITVVTDSWLDRRDPEFTALLDGKQRLEAVRAFLRGDIPAFGRFFSEFEGRLRIASATSFSWRVVVVPTLADALSLYLQINGGGVAHTREELDRVMALRERELKKARG